MARMTLEEITAQLQAAKAAGRIWNMDLIDLKDALNRRISETFQHLNLSIESLGGVEVYWDLAYPIMACNATTLLGKLKQLDKLPESGSWPELKATVRSLQQVCELAAAVKPLVVKGRRPGETPNLNPRTLEHTGTCGCCNRNIKLNGAGRIWDHGYEIEGRGRGMRGGYGYKVGGSCFGVGYPPIEVSDEVWVALLAKMERDLVSLPQRIVNQTAHVKGLPQPVDKHSWQMSKDEQVVAERYHAAKGYLGRLKLYLKCLPRDISEMKLRIASWAPKPLPGTSR